MNKVPDRVIWRRELQEIFGVGTETTRRWIAAGKLPQPDVNLTKRIQGWRLSTLQSAGVNLV
jgi:predicted DNA-binding transcriptional regulator AlpA